MSKVSDFRNSLTAEQKDYLANYGEIPGSTVDERIRNAARIIVDAANEGDIPPITKEQRLNLSKAATAKPMVYSADAVLSSLGGSEAMSDSLGKKRDSREVLVETYDAMDPTERGMYKDVFEATNGKGSWKNVKKVVENSRKDLEELKTPKKEVGTASKVFGTIFAPRSLEAWEQGRDASWKDIGLDIGENALMALPLAGWAGMGVKGVRLGKAGRVLATILANSAVPHVSEGADAIAYSPEENPERSVYSEADAITGSATNVAAPALLNRGARRVSRLLGEKFGGRDMLSNETKEIMDDLVEKGAWKKPSNETVKAVQHRDNSEQFVKDMDEATNGKWRKIFEGESYSSPVEVSTHRQMFNKNFMSGKKPTPGQVLEAGIVQSRLDDVNANLSDKIDARDFIGSPNEIFFKEDLTPVKYSDMLEGTKNLGNKLKSATILDQLHYANPNAELALQGLGSWAVNKYGSKRDADYMLSAISNLTGGTGVNPKELLESSKKKAVAEAKNEQQKRMASRVFDSLDKEDWSDEDRKYMELVKEKPGLLKGIGSEARDPKFRNWLMLRGTDILRGTDLYRPTPLVQ